MVTRGTTNGGSGALISERELEIQRNKIGDYLSRLKKRWEGLMQAKRRFEEFRRESRPHTERFLIAAGIMSLVVLVIDWWVSRNTLEAFAVQFGFVPWVLAILVSLIDGILAVVASGYMAEGELSSRRQKKWATFGMVVMGALKLLALFAYLRDEYWERIGVMEIPLGVWVQALIVVFVYVVLKLFGAGLWYIFAYSWRWFSVWLHGNEHRIRTEYQQTLDELRKTFVGNEGKFDEYLKEHSLKPVSGEVGQPENESKKQKVIQLERSMATKILRRLSQRIERAERVEKQYLRFQNEISSFPDARRRLAFTAILGVVVLFADFWVSNDVLFQVGQFYAIPSWLLALVITLLDGVSALFVGMSSEYLAKDSLILERKRFGKIGLILMVIFGFFKIASYIYFLYLQQVEVIEIVWRTTLQAILVSGIYAMLWVCGAGLWYALLHMWYKTNLWNNHKLKMKYMEVEAILFNTFAEPQEFEQHLKQHGLRAYSALPSDAAKVPLRRSEL